MWKLRRIRRGVEKVRSPLSNEEENEIQKIIKFNKIRELTHLDEC
jgi:hypothetical protein